MLLVPGLSAQPQQPSTAQIAGGERNTEIQQHRPGDRLEGHVHYTAFKPEQGRQGAEEEPGIGAEEQDLEDRVEGDQSRGIGAAAAGQLVPYQHHGDAARQADENHARHVVGVVGQEQHGQPEHQERSDQPVLDQGQHQHTTVGKDLRQFLVAHARQRRIHHHDQANRDWNVGAADAELVQCGRQRFELGAEQHTQGHRGQDPDRQIAVEKRQARGAVHVSVAISRSAPASAA